MNSPARMATVFDDLASAASRFVDDGRAKLFVKHAALAARRTEDTGWKWAIVGWRRKATMTQDLEFSTKSADTDELSVALERELKVDGWTTFAFEIAKLDSPLPI